MFDILSELWFVLYVQNSIASYIGNNVVTHLLDSPHALVPM